MDSKEKKKRYTKEEKQFIIDEICVYLMKGHSVRKYLRDKGKPAIPTLWKWLGEDEELAKQYARAKELWADIVFEEVVEISDGSGDDIIRDEEGKEQVNHKVIQRDRLRIDARKWALGKINPKKYGERAQIDQTTEHSGKITIVREEITSKD